MEGLIRSLGDIGAGGQLCIGGVCCEPIESPLDVITERFRVFSVWTCEAETLLFS